MKQVFGAALRWRLQRIEQNQAGSLVEAGEHATANALHAEALEFFARGGVAARWTLDEHQRLVANGVRSEAASRSGRCASIAVSRRVISLA